MDMTMGVQQCHELLVTGDSGGICGHITVIYRYIICHM